MSEMKQAEMVVSSNRPMVAVGDNSGDSMKVVVEFTAYRNKQDNTFFFNNLKDIKINGEMRKSGDSFKVTDEKTGEDFLLKLKLTASDSRKKWAEAPAAGKLDDSKPQLNA